MSHQNNYKELVVKGKKIMDKLTELRELKHCYQAKIAKYAMTVCEIRHGGSSIEKIYTLKDYALDIGMNYKTLQNNVQIYRNVIAKLDLSEPTLDEWKKAVKVNNILSLERVIDNKNDGAPNSRRAYKKDVPAGRVKELFTDVEEKPFETEFMAITSAAKYAKSILNRRDLNIIGEAKLLHLMEILDYNSEIINEFLTDKRNNLAG